MKTHPTYKGLIVRRIPWWMKVISYPARKARGAAFLGRIYLRSDLYDSYVLGECDPTTLRILAHEVGHIERAKKIGNFIFALKMTFSSSFKFQEEIEADKASMIVCRELGIEFPIEERARHLSSKVYYWCATYEHAKKILTEEWEKAKQKPPSS